MDQGTYVATFTQHYAIAMIWANVTVERNGKETGQDTEPNAWQDGHSDDWAVTAFDADAQASIRGDCRDFVTANWADLASLDPEQCGHDFALTRNGHGAGFWDRGLGERGERLSKAAKVYGESSGWYDADEFDDGRAVVHLF